MDLFIKMISWLIGLAMVLVGVTITLIEPLHAIVWFTCACLVLPPMRNLFYEQFKFKIPFPLRFAILLLLLLPSLILLGLKQEKIEKELARQRHEEKEAKRQSFLESEEAYFREHKAEMLDSLKGLLKNGMYGEILKIGEILEGTGDSTLAVIVNRATVERDSIDRIRLTRRLSSDAATLPVTDYSGRLDAYIQLSKLRPGEKLYSDSMAHYNYMLQEESKIKKRQERIESQFSSWDGSHKKLSNMIKYSLDDPGSYSHVKTSYADKDDYLIVRTTYRALNVQGLRVLHTTTARVGLNGEVLEILD